MDYTNELIKTLIECPKKITKAPSKHFKSDRGHLRNDFEMQSLDGQYNFTCFVRVNEQFMENFSIGMDFIQTDEPGSIVLLRCNGAHGHKDIPHHNYCHIHKATAETIETGLKPESSIEITTDYSSYQEAIAYFLRLTNIKDGNQYFPTDQLSLFKS